MFLHFQVETNVFYLTNPKFSFVVARLSSALQTRVYCSTNTEDQRPFLSESEYFTTFSDERPLTALTTQKIQYERKFNIEPSQMEEIILHSQLPFRCCQTSKFPKNYQLGNRSIISSFKYYLPITSQQVDVYQPRSYEFLILQVEPRVKLSRDRISKLNQISLTDIFRMYSLIIYIGPVRLI